MKSNQHSIETMPKKIVQLTPPALHPGAIKETITCIRAHRERIFQVYTHWQDSKLICHNYGHGGAGWTFLFGCVETSIKQYEEELSKRPDLKNKPVTVVGAGCFGLTTAISLALKGINVTIVAKETTETPSYKAAGFFFPRARKCSTPAEREIFLSTGTSSYRTYLSIINGNHSFIKKGPKILPAYYGMDIDPGFKEYITTGLLKQPEPVVINFGNNRVYEAMEYHTVFINPSIIMQELNQAIKDLNIPILQTEIKSFHEIEHEVIFNCAGLGAKTLADDARIVPVQGHLITLTEQPDTEDLQYMINFKVVMTNAQGRQRDELIYFAPKDAGILGITFIRGQDSLTANSHEFERLLQRSRDFFGT